MMDISDGLSSEAMHICKNSQVGCRIYEERIPIDYQTAVTAEEFNFNVYTAALNGGKARVVISNDLRTGCSIGNKRHGVLIRLISNRNNRFARYYSPDGKFYKIDR